MAERTFPNVGLKGGYEPGENGWGDAQNLNLLTLSVLTQGTVIDKVAAEPGSPAAGDVYLLDETHATHANAVAVFDGPALDEEWVYIQPQAGWLLYNQAAEYYEKFDGTVWAELETGGGGGGIPEAPADGETYARKDGAWVALLGETDYPLESIVVAVGDETNAITAGTAKVTFRMPYAFDLTAVRASLKTASSSGNPTVDINESGVSILSTKLSIDSGEKTSVTAATAAVISDAALADDAEMTIDIDTAGTGAVGLKVTLIGRRAS